MGSEHLSSTTPVAVGGFKTLEFVTMHRPGVRSPLESCSFLLFMKKRELLVVKSAGSLPALGLRIQLRTLPVRDQNDDVPLGPASSTPMTVPSVLLIKGPPE